MKYFKKIFCLLTILALLLGLYGPNIAYANVDEISSILSSMTNEEKIAQMLMPAFRKRKDSQINNDNIKEILSTYNYAGAILFAENTADIESTYNFVEFLQESNKDNKTRLLIAIDQEGGYVTRLGVGTTTVGNMALGATSDPKGAYNSAKIIGSELKALGINTDFAPVVDVNSNPENPVIGVRSFSDDGNRVAVYGKEFMLGLQSEGIATSLKHFPGHGDTQTDTHTGLSIIDKTYEELKQSELVPFKALADAGTDMIMTAHIQYPNIEKNTYVSIKDGKTYTLPATLSKTILTDILRKDMGYNGVIVTDALDMGAIAEQFEKVDASIKAINAGADILLMPFIYDDQKDELKAYVEELASKVGTEINETNVNASVKRILTLKQKKGLLKPYVANQVSLDQAKSIVSGLSNHQKQLDIAKKTITMIKNEDSALPIKKEDKTLVLYEYESHIKAVSNAIDLLKKDGKDINTNIDLYSFYSNDGSLDLDDLKNKVKDYDKVIMLHSLYRSSDIADPDLDKMGNLVDYIHENNGKAIFVSTQLPYDLAKFTNADSIVLTYYAGGINFSLSDYTSQIPKYGPNMIAAFYMMLSNKDDLSAVLPVNIYEVDKDNKFTSNILFNRGYGLTYYSNEHRVLEGENQEIDNTKELTIKVEGKLEDVVSVAVDNNLLDESNYTLKSGSVIVTLNGNYLKTLDYGTHTITVGFKDGSAATAFTLNEIEESEENPNTLDNISIYIGLLLLSISVIAFIKHKKLA